MPPTGDIVAAMKKPSLLRIDSSARIEASHSRALADSVVARLLELHPDCRVTQRDLALAPVPHITDTTIAGFYGGESSPGLELSDHLIAELLQADIILLSVPVYNFTIPSSLKAWVDHVVRMNHTFAVDSATGGFVGLLGGKHVVICAAYGVAGYHDGPLASVDHLLPYLRDLFGFLAVADFTSFAIEGSSTEPENLPDRMRHLAAEINEWSPAIAVA